MAAVAQGSYGLLDRQRGGEHDLVRQGGLTEKRRGAISVRALAEIRSERRLAAQGEMLAQGNVQASLRGQGLEGDIRSERFEGEPVIEGEGELQKGDLTRGGTRIYRGDVVAIQQITAPSDG